MIRTQGISSIRVWLSGATLLWLSLAASRCDATAGTARDATLSNATPGATHPNLKSTSSDGGMSIRGGQEGTVLKSLTVEGEDRIHLEIERPTLKLDLDPLEAPGLELGNARDVLDRTAPDLCAPLVASTAQEPSPFIARPWLQQFASGVVARFHPDVEGTERWRLVIADSRGQTVTSYEGHGQPPREIAWDGRTKAGATVVPGLTYSYVFEAHDRAGNKRNFVGQGFKVSAYRLTSPDGSVLVFSARELGESQARNGTPTGFAGSPILLEAASWINQSGRPRQPVRVTATARSFDRASELAQGVAGSLASLIMGDPARIQNVAQVEPDAPEDGVVKIAPAR